MKRFWHREWLFACAWRIAFFVLPWQTRWFMDATLGGWPWEQGRLSVYVSMGALIVTIALGMRWIELRQLMKSRLAWGAVVLIVLTLATTLSLRASVQWWVQVLLLGALVWTLRFRKVALKSLLAWSVASVIPHACLAVWQYLVGVVSASTWLGIAFQHPEQLGVAVVEHGDVRFLRAYGGFPHPNILGGWMAYAVVVAVTLASTAVTRWHSLWWTICAALCSVALVVSFSRGAWLACVAGLGVWGVSAWVQHRRDAYPEFTFQFAALACCAIFLMIFAVGYAQRAQIFVRVSSTERLEQQSISVREQSIRDGAKTFIASPLVGTGPNAELVPLAAVCGERCLAPLVPPHLAPLLMLVNGGVLGAAFVFACLWRLGRFVTWATAPFVALLVPLALVDHYLWSTWSGMCLVAVVAGCALAVNTNAGGRLNGVNDVSTVPNRD